MAIRGIIPAAGKGLRVGMLLHQSKELLIDPETNQPLIEFHLKQCKRYNIKPLVLLRKEKKDLIKYCKKKKVEYLIIPNHNGEWYDTILMSKHRWYKWNILMLPDTKYLDPADEETQFLFQKRDLDHNIIAFTNTVSDITKWGLCTTEDDQGFAVMCEKPSLKMIKNLSERYEAWGILAFNKVYGQYLMKKFKTKKPFVVDNIITFQLDGFVDLTRDKSLNLSFKRK